MESETTALTETSSVPDSNAVQASGHPASSVIMGVIAMALIYAAAVASPKLAAFVDRLFSFGKSPSSSGTEASLPDNGKAEESASQENYRVHDIYEGELNLDENTDKKE